MEELVIIGLLLLLGGGDTPGGEDLTPKPKPKPLPPPVLPPLVPPKPKPGFVDLGEAKPLPKPPAKPATPQAVPTPSGKIQISSDCKTAILAPGWEDAIRPTVEAAIASGAGLPVYSPALADRSVDAVIRTVVSQQTGNGCINAAPWLDRYVKSNPPPLPKQGQSVFDYYKARSLWDDAWDTTFGTWAMAHKPAYEAFREIGAYIVGRWAGDVGVTPRPAGAGGPGSAVTSIPATSKPADIQQLRMLGYDIAPGVVEEFQEDFNMVKDAQTDFGWTKFGYALVIDDKAGPMTRAALAEALQMAGGSSQAWGMALAAARESLGA